MAKYRGRRDREGNVFEQITTISNTGEIITQGALGPQFEIIEKDGFREVYDTNGKLIKKFPLVLEEDDEFEFQDWKNQLTEESMVFESEEEATGENYSED